MDLVVGAVSMKSVLVKIADMLSQDHALIQDVHSELVGIIGKLSTVHASLSCCYLNRLERGSDGDEQIQRWARRVRDVAYDAENRVDHVRLRLSRWPEPRRGRGPIFSMPGWWFAICTRHVRREIAAEIGGLLGQAEGLGEEGPVANSGDNTDGDGDGDGDGASTSFQHAAQPAPLLLMGAERPLGLKQAVADLPPWFASGDKDPELRAVVIVGSGGLGKSTLAGELLSVFGEQFHSCAAVLASRRFNLGLFLRILLKQIMPPFEYDELQLGVSDGWKDDELRQKVEEQFLDKRYIVVIDDVWSVPSWKIIQECLPENGKGSRVLVTTRDSSVATAIKLQQVHVHNLNPLDKDHSRILLQRKLGDNNQPESTDSAASRIILDKCGGVPLAIVALAGFLANVPASDSIAIRMEACASTFPEQENGTTPVQIMKEIFDICYNDLPAYLKTAFLCLSIFPIGFSISRKRLIRWWIAQGFIADRHGKSAEQVAEESFSELVRRNMIQPVEIGINGKVKTFQVHDVIIENIVSASSEENFITVLDGCSCETVPAAAIKNVRWLSIHGSRSNPLCVKEEVKKTSMNFLHVRSLTAFGSIEHLDSFTILQVLDLEGCGGDLGAGQLTMICKMDLLKYLSLRRTGVKALPSKIQRLQFLETLDIRETNVRRLPRSIGRLKRMVHLLSGDKRRGLALLLTKGITEMSKLKTLSGVKIDRRSTAALGGMDNLTSLEKLSIYNVSRRKSLWFLSHSSSLTSLAVNDGFTGFVDELDFPVASFNHLRTLKLSGKLSKVPCWMNSMQFLQELTLSLTSLRMATLELLSDLPMLCLLVFSTDAAEHYADVLIILKENASESGGEIFVPARGFHRLHTLHFSGVGLPLLTFLQGAMPELQRLKLRFRMIDGIYGLENLGNLHMVDLKVSKQASELAKEMVRQIKSSVNKHPKRPVMICDEYSEW